MTPEKTPIIIIMKQTQKGPDDYFERLIR